MIHSLSHAEVKDFYDLTDIQILHWRNTDLLEYLEIEPDTFIYLVDDESIIDQLSHCEICLEPHNGKYGSGRFCSRKCSQIRRGPRKR